MHGAKNFIYIVHTEAAVFLTAQGNLFQLLQKLSGLVDEHFYHRFCHTIIPNPKNY